MEGRGLVLKVRAPEISGVMIYGYLLAGMVLRSVIEHTSVKSWKRDGLLPLLNN